MNISRTSPILLVRILWSLVVAGVLGLLLVGCGEDKPTVFSRGEPIPLGDTTLTVSYMEEHSAFPTYRPQAGKTHVVVFFSMKGLGEVFKDEKAPQKEMLALVTFRLVTDDGQRYSTMILFPEVSFRALNTRDKADLEALTQGLSGQSLDNWVAIFIVPDKSRGFRLLIKNHRQKQGQPALAEVSLGR